MPEVHGIDKGADPTLRPEKQVIMPLSTPMQSNVPTKLKSQTHAKLRVGQSKVRDKEKKYYKDFPFLHVSIM